MNPATFLSLSTTRLLCTRGGSSSVGTGFFYEFEVVRENSSEIVRVPTIVTNKHVVATMETLRTTLTLSNEGHEVTDAIVDQRDVHHAVVIDALQNRIVEHPESDVDVCIIAIGDILASLPTGKILRHAFLRKDAHLPEDERSFTRAIEPIVMIGYPNGLWDEANNTPISRRGLTASHPLQNWNGRRQFVVDAACFPGSSGSPVFLYEDGMYRNGANAYSAGTRARLLGLLFSGPVISQDGRLEVRSIPTNTALVPVVQGMMNLGFVAHADTISDFLPILVRIVEHQHATAISLSQLGARPNA